MLISELIYHLTNLKEVCGDTTVHLFDVTNQIETFEIRESKYLSTKDNITYPKQTYIIIK